MNKILSKTYFSEKVVKLEVEAPLIAKARKPGNFVIVRVGEKGERMPLTIADANLERGSITLVVQVSGSVFPEIVRFGSGGLYHGFGRSSRKTDSYREGRNRVGLRWWCWRGSSTAHRASFQGGRKQGGFSNCRT